MFIIAKRYFFIFFLFLVLSALLPTSAVALDLSYRIDPTKIRLSIPAKGAQAGTIKVYNQSGNSIKVKTYLEDWVYSKLQDGTKDFFVAKTTPLSGAEWLSFSPADFVLPPHGVQKVNYVVRVPEGAQGGRFSVMFFETEFLGKPEEFAPSAAQEIRSGATLNVRLGALFYVEVKGAAKLLAELTNLSVAQEARGRQLLVEFDFENVGNTDIGAGGTFHIMDDEGVIYARGEFNNAYTLPGDTAKLSSTWKETLPQGKYILVITLDLGKYREELGRGPILVKEAEIEIDESGEVARVGKLK